MAKNETFEEKIIKKLKNIEERLDTINNNVYDSVDTLSSENLDDIHNVLDSMSNTLSDIADALANETYVNGTRYGSAFDVVKEKQDEMIKALHSVQDDIGYIYNELEDVNSNIISFNRDFHDNLVQAIRDAMNPDYTLSTYY